MNVIKCDAFGCDESHPINHESVGEPGFGIGKWMGWVYLDVNRPDLFDRPLRFCSLGCLLHWLGQNAASNNAIDARIDPVQFQLPSKRRSRR